jgi:adenylate cyclase
MTETRKLAAILAADVAGYSKLAGSDEERTLARLRALRSDLIATTALHHGRIVKRTGGNDPGWRLEFRYVGNSRRAGSPFQALRSRNCNASWRLPNGRPCAGFALVTPNICKGLVGGR